MTVFYKVMAFYNKFSQGISVGGCALMSIGTLGYMLNDSHNIQMKLLETKYGKQIIDLNNEINNLKLENEMMKTKLKY